VEDFAKPLPDASLGFFERDGCEFELAAWK
jgi:hypothetical protein